MQRRVLNLTVRETRVSSDSIDSVNIAWLFDQFAKTKPVAQNQWGHKSMGSDSIDSVNIAWLFDQFAKTKPVAHINRIAQKQKK